MLSRYNPTVGTNPGRRAFDRPDIPPLTDNPAPPITLRTILIGLIGVTLINVILFWPAIFQNRILMSDAWVLHYPWTVEPGLDSDSRAVGPIGDGSEPYSVKEPYVHAYDIYFENYIWYGFAKSELLAGRIPHWNPNSFCGSLLYANHLVPLAHPPLMAAILLAPVSRIHTVATFLTLWFAGLGLFLYLTVRRLSPWAALIGVVLYLTCGHFMPLVPFQASGLMWFPWLLWASDSLDARPTFARMVPFALIIGFQLAAGHPGYIMPFIYMIILHRVLLWIFTRKPRSFWLKRVGIFALAFLIGALLSAVQNIPTWQLLKSSSRPISASLEEKPICVGEPATNYLGTIEAKSNRLVEAPAGKMSIVLAPVFQREIQTLHRYVGFSIILLAFIGIPYIRPSPERKTLMILLAIFTVIAAPPVFYRVARFLPGLAMSPCLPVAAPQFLLIMTASIGLHEILGGTATRYIRLNRAYTVFAIFGVILAAVLFIPQSVSHPDTRWEIESVKLAVAVAVTGIPAILLIAASLCLGLRIRWLTRFAMPVVLIASAFLGHFYQYPVFTKQPIMPETESIAALPKSSMYRVARHSSGRTVHAGSVRQPLTFGGNLPMWVGCLDAQGADSFTLIRNVNILRAIDPKSLEWNGLALPFTAPGALSSPLLDAMAVKTIISDNPNLLADPDAIANPDKWETIHTGGLNIYRRKEALPRYYLAYRAIVAVDPANAIELMKTTTIFGDEPGVVMEGVESIPEPDQSGNGGRGRVELMNENPQYVELKVDTPAPAWLVLSDSYHPQWRAFIDDIETKVYPANGAFRTVRVAPGEHRVVFRYIPKDFYFGALISGLALLFLVIGSATELAFSSGKKN